MAALIPALDDVTDQGEKTDLDLVMPEWKAPVELDDRTVTYEQAGLRAEVVANSARPPASVPPSLHALSSSTPAMPRAPSSSGMACDSAAMPLAANAGRLGARAPAAATSQRLAAVTTTATPALWDEPERRRAIPRRFKLLAGGAVLAVLLLLTFGGRRPAKLEKQVVLTDDMVVNQEDLKKRREVSAADFRPRHEGEHADVSPPRQAPVPPPVPVAAEAPVVDARELVERRARRSDDPEDVQTHRRRDAAPGAAAAAPALPPPADIYRRSEVLAPTAAVEKPTAGAPPVAPALAAGSTVAGELVTPLELGSGSSTAVVRVVNGPLRGARFLGAASLSSAGNRVTMTFRKLVLADGRAAHLEAEAQDVDGAFGIATSVKETGNEEPSVARNVASDTVEDVAGAVLGGGIPGTAVSSYLRETRTRGDRRRGYSRTGALPTGTPVVIFLHEAPEFR